MTMSGLAIFTDDYDPTRLYAAEGAADRDPTLVERAVRFDDGPADLLVEFEESGGRVVWSFRGKRDATTNRTEYFLADFAADDALFQSFARALMGLDDDWILSHAGDLRWDLGFDLWRIPPDTPGLSASDREQLFDHLAKSGASDSDPLVFGMRDHRSAIALVRAIQEAGIECRVAVGEDGDLDAIPDVDLLLIPDAVGDFEAQSLGVETVIGAPGPDSKMKFTTEEPTTNGANSGSPTFGLAHRIAGAIVFVLLGFAGYSFLSKDPVHPITGLSTIGGFVGSVLAIAAGRRYGPADGPGLVSPAGEMTWDLRLSGLGVIAIAYGTVLAFVFPTLFRVGGAVLTPQQWLFGSVAGLESAVLSVSLYIIGMFIVAMVTVWVLRQGTEGPRLDENIAATLVLVHLLYAACLAVANGLATGLWYSFIPSVGL
jgi:hypothetical protein